MPKPIETPRQTHSSRAVKSFVFIFSRRTFEAQPCRASGIGCDDWFGSFFISPKSPPRLRLGRRSKNMATRNPSLIR
jgi:hypothetical protein